MGLNKQSGNMYPWINATWNPIKGLCPHACPYCYIGDINRRFKKDPGILRFDEEELKTDLGEGRTIFVGSSVDMWAREVHWEWIERVLAHCREFNGNQYLFQTKNPAMFWGHELPHSSILGITLETNRDTFPSAPSPRQRARTFSYIHHISALKMVSVEPIMDFDLLPFVEMIKEIKPRFVSIGADSKRHDLPEPKKEKVAMLIEELMSFTEIRVKSNLERLQ